MYYIFLLYTFAFSKFQPVYREKQPFEATSGLSRSMPNLSEWPEPMTREELEEWKGDYGKTNRIHIEHLLDTLAWFYS